MTAAALLLAAAKLIEREGAWSRGAEARTRYGKPVCPRHPKACKWCAIGAVEHLGGGASPKEVIDALCALARLLNTNVADFNDSASDVSVVTAKMRQAAGGLA